MVSRRVLTLALVFLVVLAVVGGVVILVGCCLVAPTDDSSSESVFTPLDASATPAESRGDGGSAPNGTLAVHFVNVGQSASVLLVGPTGETMLVDTGDFTDDGDEVLAYLQRANVTRLDHLVTTHADADHIGGHAAVITYYETEADGVGAVYDPGLVSTTATYGRYLDAVETYDVPLYEVRTGDELPFAGATVRVLAPPDPYLAGERRNENSVVLHVTFGETSVLLTGDAEETGEAYLVERYGSELRTTVLQAGHHGSRTSTSDALLNASEPLLVVVSSDYDSQFGHPHEETLDRFAARSLPTYWTGTHGDVVVVSNGETLTVSTQRAAPTDPLELRDAPAVESGTADPVRERLRLRVSTGEQTTPVLVTDGGDDARPDGDDEDGRLVLVSVHADAAGDDRTNLGDEYVVFENTGDVTLDLSGWTVRDERGATYTFPVGATLVPGERLTLSTGAGTDTTTRYYWNASSPVWNNDGDVVTVMTAAGEPVLQEAY
ncbi:competence protein ComEC [Halogranum rubrum]|uniref:Competence protein ComEC n=1 Tax=Halogranum rubrum TaxID=553466 RepID=A0A1I4FCE3_9EURY|nr:lamin tail domain-containing protein [Halogranum rubrum]SFL15143.1 competence protein ComEC [Halogranum rubrum]